MVMGKKSRFTDDFIKSSNFKARESRVTRRTCRTPQRQRDEAQRRSWTFYEVVNVDDLAPSGISDKG